MIALDPGFGNTKTATWDGNVVCIQSAVARPREIGRAGIGMRAGKRPPLVTSAGQSFLVGPGAWNQGEMLGSMDYAALAGPERLALFYATLASSAAAEWPESATLVIGLPVPLLVDKERADATLAALRTWKRRHEFEVDKTSHAITIERIKVLAQPVGAYTDWLLDEHLHTRKGGAQAQVAVLDIGMNTLDLYVIQNGEFQSRYVGGEKVGVRKLLEYMGEGERELEEMDYRLRRGQLKPDTVALESWLAKILAAVEPVWPKLSRFSAVIPTGGGASLLGDRLRNSLASRGAALHWPEDPLTANVRGLWKWGCQNVGH